MILTEALNPASVGLQYGTLTHAEEASKSTSLEESTDAEEGEGCPTSLADRPCLNNPAAGQEVVQGMSCNFAQKIKLCEDTKSELAR